jgi:hypothetical protein
MIIGWLVYNREAGNWNYLRLALGVVALMLAYYDGLERL